MAEEQQQQAPVEQPQAGTTTEEKPKEQPAPPWGSDEEFDPEKAWNLIQNLRSEKEELKPLAAKAKELEQAQLTEQERLAAQLEEARGEGSSAKSEAARLRAAIKHGLTEDDLELLGEGTPEQIEARAEKLAARLAPPEVDSPKPGRRPQERLRPGATPSAEPEKTTEELADEVIKARGY